MGSSFVSLLDTNAANPYQMTMARRYSLLIAVFLAAWLLCTAAHALPVRGEGLRADGDGTITLYRPDKNERATFAYLDTKGRLDIHTLDRIAHFFRCRLTDEQHDIAPELIRTIDAISDRFGGKEIQIISGYRSPTRNGLMRLQGRRVAKNSLHMVGMAADIVIEGVAPAAIRDAAYGMQRGGVGYYGSRSFVHVDAGPLRTWGWKPPTSSRTAAAAK